MIEDKWYTMESKKKMEDGGWAVNEVNMTPKQL